MNNYLLSCTLLLKRILYVISAYSLVRIGFLAFHWNSFQNVSFFNFIGGIRFDLSVIFYSNILLIALHTIPGRFKYKTGYQKVLKLLFYVVNLVFISTNFIDFIYYKFTGKRSTFDLITAKGMEQEIGGLLPDFAKRYWYVLLLFIMFAYLFYQFLPKTKHPFTSLQKATLPNNLKQIFVFLIVTASCILIGRGGVQRKPLRRVDAIKYATANNTPIVLNTPFCILKTMGRKHDLQPFHFYKNDELAKQFSPVKQFQDSVPFIKKNVVVIILESFGDENVSYSSPDEGNTPFLDSIIKKSMYFKNGFANGRVSADAVPSVISGIPNIIGQPYVSSTYAFNKVNTLPKLLKAEGYNTSFFHGAFNGSQNFNQYAKIAGFDAYYGKNEYPQTSPDEEDGKWGIFDEEFLGYFGKKLTSFKEPFFSSIFTISSHIPFIIPKKHKGKFKKGNTIFYETVGYTDYSLKKFFNYAKQQKWYKNTLFVFVADHCSMGKKGGYISILQEYSIPILFFDPTNEELASLPKRNFQQIDILPSILKYLHYTKPFISYGFEYTTSKNLVINFINGMYHATINDYYLIFDGTKTIELYNYKKDSTLQNNILLENPVLQQDLTVQLKAYLQSLNNNLINNTLTIE